MQEWEHPLSTVIFLHVPKAAGTSFKRILDKNYHVEQTYLVRGKEGEDEFKALPDAEKRRFRLIYGHQYFGLHEYLPQPSTYIAFLRDPITRAISHYYFVRRVDHHELHEHATQVTLEEYIEQEIAGKELDNGQTRRLAGVRDEVDCTEEMFELAKANIARYFRIIGVSERFDETLLLSKRLFHWNNIYYRRLNRTGRSRPEVSARVLNVLHEKNQYDIRLYEHANKLLDVQWREQSATPEQSLRLFRAANFLYGLPYEIAFSAVKRIPGMDVVLSTLRNRPSR